MGTIIINKFSDGWLNHSNIPNLRNNDSLPFLHFPEEYDGASDAKLCCTQSVGVKSEYQQKKISQKWCDFLTMNKLPLKRVHFCTRTPQLIFDAICNQDSLTSLYFKWCAAKDIKAIKQLKDLKQLFIGIGTSIEDISPLAELTQLEALYLENTKKITDYTCLRKLKNLKELAISGNWRNFETVNVDSVEFLNDLPKLEILDLSSAKIADKSFLKAKSFESFLYAAFPE